MSRRHHLLPWIFAGLLGTTAGCQVQRDSEISEQFQQAELAFQRKEYQTAAGIYDQIVASGLRSGVIFYNQGNSLMKAGMRGEAIAAYRQAQRYRPRDSSLAWNLRTALGEERNEAASLVDHILFWKDWLGYLEKFQLLGLAALATCGFGIWAFYSDHPRIWNRLALLSLLVTAALGASAGYDWYRYEWQVHGVITEDVLARKGNSEGYDPAFTEPLTEGTEFTVARQRQDWLEVRLDKGLQGWVPLDSTVLY